MSGSDSHSELAPDASIGEIRAEIDSARHDAARTLGELAHRFTVREQVRRAALPPGVTDTGKKMLVLFNRVPMWVRIGLPALLLLRILMHRRNR
ncbi:MAG TPA: DUF3618 domain-containing protein [Pseudonocardiaceae bacterium]|nr:DUF3618 domain-containing protein [Pseudonocardiaceae bacterium]